MDEDQYRNTYNKLNPNRCVFEKSMNNRRCDCELKRRFLIATREGVACKSEKAQANCTLLLNTMRDKARFALKVVTIDGPMPHNKELRVQAGGMLGLEKLIIAKTMISSEQEPDSVKNIYQIVNAVLEEYGSIEKIPYSDIMKDIAACKVRIKRRNR